MCHVCYKITLREKWLAREVLRCRGNRQRQRPLRPRPTLLTTHRWLRSKTSTAASMVGQQPRRPPHPWLISPNFHLCHTLVAGSCFHTTTSTARTRLEPCPRSTPSAARCTGSEPCVCPSPAGLLAHATDLLQPTAAHKEAVLSACRLLHSVTIRWNTTQMPSNDGLP